MEWIYNWFSNITLQNKYGIVTECTDTVISNYDLLLKELKNRFLNNECIQYINKPKYHTYTAALYTSFITRCDQLDNKYNLILDDIDKILIGIELDKLIESWNRVIKYANTDLNFKDKVLSLQSCLNTFNLN